MIIVRYICVMNLFATLFSICVLSAGICSGQQKPAIRQPELILVNLSTEQNRRAALVRTKDEKGLEKLNKDVLAMYMAMRNDFSAHFTFCPVYYFLDTNIARVRTHKHDSVLLGPDGNYVSAAITEGKNYQIVSYGYPIMQMHRIGYLKEPHEKVGFDTRLGRVWVVYDEHMEQVAYTLPPHLLDKEAEYFNDKKYSYKSGIMNMRYKPEAYKLQQTLNEMMPR